MVITFVHNFKIMLCKYLKNAKHFVWISKKENIAKRNVLVICSNQEKLPALAQADES